MKSSANRWTAAAPSSRMRRRMASITPGNHQERRPHQAVEQDEPDHRLVRKAERREAERDRLVEREIARQPDESAASQRREER